MGGLYFSSKHDSTDAATLPFPSSFLDLVFKFVNY